MKAKLQRATVSDGGPNPVDVHVGAKVRMRRKFLGMSQEALAGAIGLTFQQVQKYERGRNRISASKLHEIGKTLKAPAGYFFQGYEDDLVGGQFAEAQPEQVAQKFLATAEGIELAVSFPRITNPKYRRRVLELVRTLADPSVSEG